MEPKEILRHAYQRQLDRLPPGTLTAENIHYSGSSFHLPLYIVAIREGQATYLGDLLTKELLHHPPVGHTTLTGFEHAAQSGQLKTLPEHLRTEEILRTARRPLLMIALKHGNIRDLPDNIFTERMVLQKDVCGLDALDHAFLLGKLDARMLPFLKPERITAQVLTNCAKNIGTLSLLNQIGFPSALFTQITDGPHDDERKSERLITTPLHEIAKARNLDAVPPEIIVQNLGLTNGHGRTVAHLHLSHLTRPGIVEHLTEEHLLARDNCNDMPLHTRPADQKTIAGLHAAGLLTKTVLLAKDAGKDGSGSTALRINENLVNYVTLSRKEALNLLAELPQHEDTITRFYFKVASLKLTNDEEHYQYYRWQTLQTSTLIDKEAAASPTFQELKKIDMAFNDLRDSGYIRSRDLEVIAPGMF